jgi:single-stranded-DNA-specific exonuclease
MEPFGPENMNPTFVARKVYNTGRSKIVKESHLKFDLYQNETRICGIGFNMASKMQLLQQNKPLDVVFKIEENNWNGQKSLQLKVFDLRLSEDTGAL